MNHQIYFELTRTISFFKTLKQQLQQSWTYPETVQFISSCKNTRTRLLSFSAEFFFQTHPENQCNLSYFLKVFELIQYHLCMRIPTKDCNSFQSLYQRFHWEENTGKAIMKQPATFSLQKVGTRSGHKLWYSYKDIWKRKNFPS